ncbi:hypothetical protein B0H16DRAFT_1460303 [Mycena metata]|uniref:Uncharacterized protein n=1 Tax=Mycena metata TaxID=1033252 RepID=A0AAD7N9I2_9AGAR|nr:hypothetical protein B0H16DRAFT_1460303 [Mycena metata]
MKFTLFALVALATMMVAPAHAAVVNRGVDGNATSTSAAAGQTQGGVAYLTCFHEGQLTAYTVPMRTLSSEFCQKYAGTFLPSDQTVEEVRIIYTQAGLSSAYERIKVQLRIQAGRG